MVILYEERLIHRCIGHKGSHFESSTVLPTTEAVDWKGVLLLKTAEICKICRNIMAKMNLLIFSEFNFTESGKKNKKSFFFTILQFFWLEKCKMLHCVLRQSNFEFLKIQISETTLSAFSLIKKIEIFVCRS